MYKVTIFFLLGLLVLTSGFPTEKEVNRWRIVGGSNASPGEAPYQVSLRSSSNSHFCGGSLITTRTVVTAAHCLVGRSPSNTRVVAGTIFLNSGGSSYDAIRLTNHPSYNPSQLSNDVGVVITAFGVNLGSTVSLIPMGMSTVGGGVSALLTGWGTTTYPGSAPNNLQKLTVNTITVAACRSALSSTGPIFDTQICTFTRAGQGACHGDSGGPLVASGQLIGIVSWGRPCAVGFPDVFARVSSYYNWVMSNAQ